MPTSTEITAVIMRAILVVAVLLPQPVFAQPIYKSTGPGGPVYSDVPSPGSEPLDLPQPNVADPPARPAAQPRGSVKPSGTAQPEVVAYRTLRITQPEADGSASDNTALFEVRVAVVPQLQYALGHAFVVTLNGKTVDRRYTSTEMMIPPEFFGDGVRANERFRLQVWIEGRDGNVLIEAAPVDFFMRHVATRPDGPGRPLPARPGKP